MLKPKIFISHITEEAELAKELKEFIEKRFLKSVDVFASSHEDSIKLGDDWMRSIKTSLNDSKLVMILCSPISIARPWINFEAGAGWLKGVPVIPLCHSGLTPGKLPVPMNSFQGGVLSDDKSIEQLFSRIAKLLELDPPDHKDEKFFAVTKEFEGRMVKTAIIKDVGFINNYLSQRLSLLKFCIVASTHSYDELANLDFSQINLREHLIEFNNVHNLFNMCLLQSAEPKTKIYQLLKETVEQLFEDVKFILSYGELNIPPSVRELLNSFLFTSFKVSAWYHGLELTTNSNEEIEKMLVKMIKEEPIPLVRRENANFIHYCFDYYESLELYKAWIVNFEEEIFGLLK